MHTHPGTQTGLAVKALLCDEEGVDPTRVVLGHSGDSEDVDHLGALADEGFILGMDRFGLNVETTFEARADTVVEMCRRGYADRMVLAHDAACYLDWIDPNVLAMMTQWSYLHIYDEVLPYCVSTASPRIRSTPCWSRRHAATSSTTLRTEAAPQGCRPRATG